MGQIKVLIPKVTLRGENKHSFSQRVAEQEERIQNDVVGRQVLKGKKKTSSPVYVKRKSDSLKCLLIKCLLSSPYVQVAGRVSFQSGCGVVS